MPTNKDTSQHLKAERSALEGRLDSQNRLIVALREQLSAHEDGTADERRSQIFRRAALDIVPDENIREFSNLGPVLVKDM